MAYIKFIDGIVKNPNEVRINVAEAWMFIVIFKKKKWLSEYGGY